MNIITDLQSLFRPALAGLADDPEPLLAMVRPTQDAKNGDYQANFAMPLAKKLGRKPQDVAREVIGRLPVTDVFDPPEVAGPGFINLRLTPAYLARQARAIVADDRLGVAKAPPKVYVIDYSSPNVAKPLHVGHLRSTVIGESLKRLLKFLGHGVVSDNHLGDWGTQFGMLIYGYKHFQNDAALAADPVRELARLYQLIRQKQKESGDEDGGELAEACRAETAKLHAGDPENLAIWQKFMPECVAEVEAIYDRLDVKFDEMLGESFYNPMLPGVVDELLAAGIAEESQGAVIIAFDEEKKNVAVVRKRDGAFTYTTSDLATVRYRVNEYKPDAILYVVDFRQAGHFKNLFEAARKWGYDAVELTHVSFGSVLGGDNKPLSTRNGGAAELGELLDRAIAEGAKAYEAVRQGRVERGEEVPDLTSDERQSIVQAVGLGAVKYADLSQNRTSDYLFDWSKMLSTQGNTAAYMQYAYVRCRGIFRKGGVDAEALRASAPAVLVTTPQERALALQLLRFEEALTAAAAEYLPHYLTTYLWDLAKAYSAFFEACPVLKAETADLKASRLALCDLTARAIKLTLSLLGIRTPERM